MQSLTQNQDGAHYGRKLSRTKGSDLRLLRKKMHQTAVPTFGDPSLSVEANTF